MDITLKNRKPLWIAGAALVMLYFAPQAVQSFREASAYRQRMEALNARAQAARANGVSTPAPSAPSSASLPATATASRLAGVWVGQQAETNEELCKVQVEIRDKGEAQVNGYVKLLCYPTAQYYQKHPRVNAADAFMKAMTPLAAILSGNVKDGAIAFHVDKTIGASLDGCVLTAFTVTPFGTEEVAAEWQKGTCPGGQMTLSRQSR